MIHAHNEDPTKSQPKLFMHNIQHPIVTNTLLTSCYAKNILNTSSINYTTC